jgi:hypothetical protein
MSMARVVITAVVLEGRPNLQVTECHYRQPGRSYARSAGIADRSSYSTVGSTLHPVLKRGRVRNQVAGPRGRFLASTRPGQPEPVSGLPEQPGGDAATAMLLTDVKIADVSPPSVPGQPLSRLEGICLDVAKSFGANAIRLAGDQPFQWPPAADGALGRDTAVWRDLAVPGAQRDVGGRAGPRTRRLPADRKVTTTLWLVSRYQELRSDGAGRLGERLGCSGGADRPR